MLRTDVCRAVDVKLDECACLQNGWWAVNNLNNPSHFGVCGGRLILVEQALLEHFSARCTQQRSILEIKRKVSLI
jgi:hypothetical protein